MEIRIVKERNGGFGFFLRFVSDKPDLAIYTTKKSRTIIWTLLLFENLDIRHLAFLREKSLQFVFRDMLGKVFDK